MHKCVTRAILIVTDASYGCIIAARAIVTVKSGTKKNTDGKEKNRGTR